jgi:hypothetical protein
MRIITIAIAAALLTTSGAAFAQTATDARCLLLSNAFAKQAKDATARKLAEDSLYFYLGRIPGQPTTAQLKAMFDQQDKTITDANAGAVMGECVNAVRAKVQLLQDVAAQARPATKPPAQPEGR